ncbi:single-stranded-DNA-specific exonuclease RecJ [Emticicia oligotrophica DSM 17448]|uniref:Single-stranded-DNA-specific exonuclease RecJ n=1 Tax=Emticicia oligotrophica (strain DSM 17448 / CIP 109782 / MTCC 6937 / GPTSA100-15) TaxID=929562 RepID=A0ABM5MY46_EMTOG|nr:single-stranded-DNA-specific exonuclease RecJ [Emticicia oligotrophica]AFK02083.1 single-stranded-DNA-specific exonuclease RecJ [Emticicia oligotrophica DSM 17448]
MSEKRWLYKSTPNPQTVNELAQAINVDKALASMLVQRGITVFDEARDFFRPKLEHLHDPFLMPDMEKAVERLTEALENGEKIMVYGDYDVDGTTSVALVYGYLSTFYSNLEYYNPDRYEEGYGVSVQGIEWAAEQGVSLVICLDCGIKAQDKVLLAKEKFNIDFIICDHHEPDDTLPNAVAVLDPKRKDCLYPYKELTGNGVGFKLLQAYCIRNEKPLDTLLEFLDLCVVSIASDIVPITGENRVLAFYGLKKLNENPRIGLKALKEVAGFTTSMTIENVVFVIGPRINAAGRIKHAKAAVKLLLSDDYDEALEFAHEIQKHNSERRGHDTRMTEEALAMIEGDEWMMSKAKSTVLYREDWHKGVIGIVASRCIEKYYRPTIILTKSHEKAAGSARSVAGFNLYEAIEECADLLEQFGGHTHAAGMTMPIENIDAFRLAFDEVVSKYITPEQLTPVVNIDVKIKLAEINAKFYRIMNQMAPFGPENMQPIFASENLTLKYTPRVMKEKHLRLELFEEETGAILTAVGFGMVEEHLERLHTNKYFSAAYQIDENTFNNKTSLQLMLKDIKYS